jgi:hypothetical protein
MQDEELFEEFKIDRLPVCDAERGKLATLSNQIAAVPCEWSKDI